MKVADDGSCASALVVNADSVDQTQLGMNRALVAMTSAVPPLQAFYGQSSYCAAIATDITDYIN
jgi:hypothetical protein